MTNRMFVLAMLVVMAGCSTAKSGEEASSEEVMEATEEAATSDGEEEGDAIGIEAWEGDEPVDVRARWVLELLNKEGGALSEADYDEKFNDEIHAALPYEGMSQTMAMVSQLGPFEVMEVHGRQPNMLRLMLMGAGEQRYVLTVVVEGEEPSRIRGVNIVPAPSETSELLESWEEIEAAFVETGAQTSMLAARIGEEGCEPVVAVEPGERLALGSAFKLYVLGALAAEVAAGRVSYDQEIEIVDEQKSLPSGVMQDLPAGETVTVREAAEKMISISDNTATDHLIALLGREVVEGYLEDFWHGAPEEMMPFLTTREMFQLKLGMDEAARDRFVAMNEEEKRAFLDGLAGEEMPGLEEAVDWTTPRHVDSIEWFASGEELCEMFRVFRDHREEPGFAEAMEIMAINPGGVEFEEGEVNYVGYKGGAEPGVLNMSWMIEGADGEWYSLVMSVNDGENQVALTEVHDLARGAARLLVKEGGN